MPDICMCHNGMYCPKATSCYRYMATPDEYQTVADFYKPDEDCDHYWEMRNANKIQTDDKDL